MSCLSHLNDLLDGKKMAMQLLFYRMLLPGYVKTACSTDIDINHLDEWWKLNILQQWGIQETMGQVKWLPKTIPESVFYQKKLIMVELEGNAWEGELLDKKIIDSNKYSS